MQIHSIATIWPSPSAEDYAMLRDSIAEHGQILPAYSWRGQLVDGRQRQRACEETGREFRAEALPDDWPEERVAFHVAGLHARRNLTTSQRDLVAAMLVERYAGSKGAPAGNANAKQDCCDAQKQLAPLGANCFDAPRGNPTKRKAAAKAAEAVGAKPRGVERGRRVLRYDEREGTDYAAKIREGKLTTRAAEREIRIAEAERALAERIAPLPEGIRIECGDARDLAAQLIPESIACVVTDPPYGLEVHRTRGAKDERDYADGAGAHELLRDVLSVCKPALRPDAHVYVFAGYDGLDATRKVLHDLGFLVQRNPLVWVKDNHTMCDFSQWYPSRYEFVLFARSSKARLLAECVPDVLSYARSSARSIHSAAKPVDLLSALIRQSTRANEVVLDPFAGSGSTLVAAKQCGRGAVGFEVDEKYVADAKGRLGDA